ncbi:MAG TPA: hypothetical protein VE422_32725 [Terriglobia bacterium]|nr:hypothetical protein [Terriglobia bacterium]
MAKKTIQLITGVLICLAPLCVIANGQNQPSVSLEVKVDAEGVNPLPDQSTIELSADADSDCGRAIHHEKPLHDGKATFKDVPVCRVVFTILVTGFPAQKIPVDLAEFKEFAILIEIKISGPAQISADK